jgi:hypothetical protein
MVVKLTSEEQGVRYGFVCVSSQGSDTDVSLLNASNKQVIHNSSGLLHLVRFCSHTPVCLCCTLTGVPLSWNNQYLIISPLLHSTDPILCIILGILIGFYSMQNKFMCIFHSRFLNEKYFVYVLCTKFTLCIELIYICLSACLISKTALRDFS